MRKSYPLRMSDAIKGIMEKRAREQGLSLNALLNHIIYEYINNTEDK